MIDIKVPDTGPFDVWAVVGGEPGVEVAGRFRDLGMMFDDEEG